VQPATEEGYVTFIHVLWLTSHPQMCCGSPPTHDIRFDKDCKVAGSKHRSRFVSPPSTQPGSPCHLSSGVRPSGSRLLDADAVVKDQDLLGTVVVSMFLAPSTRQSLLQCCFTSSHQAQTRRCFLILASVYRTIATLYTVSEIEEYYTEENRCHLHCATWVLQDLDQIKKLNK
jgi:hypothetical protein